MWKYEQALREATVSCPDGLTDVALTRRIPCFLCYEAPDNETKVIVPCSALNQVYQEMSVKILTRKHFMVKIWQPWAISKKNTSGRNQCSVDMTVKLLWQLYTCYNRWYNSCYVIRHYFFFFFFANKKPDRYYQIKMEI